MQSYYELLGLSPGADADAVRRAWRHCARVYHPDQNPSDPEAILRFQAVVEAYRTLGDEERRRAYDATLAPATAARNGNGGASAGGGGEPRKAKIPDRAIRMAVPYAVNVSGGVVRVVAPGVGRCATCHGSGRVGEGPCAVCEGSGNAEPPRGYPMWLAAGMLDGGTLRVPGAGWPSDTAGRGDLVVRLDLEDPPGMRREGTTVFTTVRVPRSLATRGGTVTVTTPDGERRMEMPPGTLDGARLSLGGLGLRAAADGARGDLVVQVEVR